MKTLWYLVWKRYFIWCEKDIFYFSKFGVKTIIFGVKTILVHYGSAPLKVYVPIFFSYNKYGFTWPPPPPFNAMSPISVFFLWSIPNLRNRNVEIMIMKTTNLLEQCTAVSSKHQSWLLLLLGLFSCLCLWSLFIVKMIKMTEKLQTTSWENSPQLQFWTKSKKEKNR